MKILKDYIFVVLLLVISMFSILPLSHPGFFSMHDDTQVSRVFVMSESLKSGMFPVRWVEDLGYGYGYPIFNFYSPLPYYFGGILDLSGFDSLTATKISFGFGILLAGISMYLLVRNFFGSYAGSAAGIIYLYFPYHAVNAYVRGALGELFAYALLPLVFLGLFKLYENGKHQARYLLVSALSISAVILSHNLSAFMLALFVLLFGALSLIFSEKRKNLLGHFGILGVLIFLLTAFYTIPAIAEMKYTNISSQVGGGADYKDHYICLSQLWNSQWGYGGSTKSCIDGLSFKLGKINILMASASIGYFLYSTLRRDKKKTGQTFLVGTSILFLILSVFMTLSYSRAVWSALPSFEYIQYPWRFLNFAGLFISVLIGYLVFALGKKIKQFVMLACVLIIGVTIFYNAKLFIPQTYIDRDNFIYTSEIYIKWFVSKISDEYMPRDFQKPKNTRELRDEDVEIISGEGNITNISSKPGLVEATVNNNKDTKIRINRAYFPRWRVFLNEKETPFNKKNDGLYIDVPSGTSTIQAKFTQSQTQWIGNILSLSGLSAIIILLRSKKLAKFFNP